MTTSTATQLFVVCADYRCHESLTGHSGCSYASPPQPAAQALALVRVLLGCTQEPLQVADAPWRRAAAGGMLVVQLLPANPDGQLTL